MEAARRTLRSLTAERRACVAREVTVELVCVLQRAYVFSRDRIATIPEELVATGDLVIEEAEDVARSAFRYRSSNAGLSDLMILAAAERSGAQPLYTFDRKAAQLDGVTLL